MYTVTPMLSYVRCLVLRALHITSRQFEHSLVHSTKNKANLEKITMFIRQSITVKRMQRT